MSENITESTVIIKKKRRGRIPSKEISIFCAQTAMLLKAGIPLSDGLDSMVESSSGAGVSLIRQIADTVGMTGSLYEALLEADIFPAYMVQMVRIGETVGKLEEVLYSLSAYYNREGKMRDAIKSAVLYPIILIFLMASVISVMVVLVLPVFSNVFESMGSETTGSVVETGALIGKITLFVMAFLILIAFIAFCISFNKKGRAKMLALTGHIPVFRKVYMKMTSSRFTFVISMMLTSGFDLDEALKMSVDVVSDKAVKIKIEECRAKLEAGKSFSEAISDIGLFTGLHSRMIVTGEKAGRIDEAMDRLAEEYSIEVDESIATLVSVIEPTLVVALSVIIGAILLSIMLPLVEIMTIIS